MGNEATVRVPQSIAHPTSHGGKVVSFHLPENHCHVCGVRASCLAEGLSEPGARELQSLAGTPRHLARREVLYRAGDTFTALYSVRLGTLKSVVLAEDGRAQITGYHLGGDLVGLDGIGQGTHTCDVVALEDSEVCVLPFERIERLAQREPVLLRNLVRLLSGDRRRGQDLILLLGSLSAEERLATFLLHLAHRYCQRGFSASEFVLRMTRDEIASYLGLKLETVSRIFSRLQGEGLIQVQGRAVKLLDHEGLKDVAGRAVLT